jgi:ERCC4-type nuclease
MRPDTPAALITPAPSGSLASPSARRDPAAAGALPVGRRRSPAGVQAQAEQMPASVPGVSRMAARRLLEHFGSIAVIAASSERELQAVVGIGRRRAASLHRALDESHRTQP